jgi:hypothetical protein
VGGGGKGGGVKSAVVTNSPHNRQKGRLRKKNKEERSEKII